MSRAWAYVISRPLTAAEREQLNTAGQAFVKQWTAHEQQLSASFELVEQRLLLVRVNEQVTGASGCSIDKLTRFLRGTEQELGLELMNRMLVAYEQDGTVKVLPANEVKAGLQSGALTADTLVYNTAIANDEDLKNWKQPLKNTWLRKYIG